jgi:rod shape determining protein RodA
MRPTLLPISSLSSSSRSSPWQRIWQKLHVDLPLLAGILALIAIGLVILYSATNKNWPAVSHQIMSMALAFSVMMLLAQVPPHRYRALTPWIYSITLMLLAAVLILGVVSQGAQRWLNLGLLRFQPSEIMKIATPMMLSWYLKDKQLPPDLKTSFYSLAIIIVPVLMIAKQPDLGTALVIAATGILVIFLSGINWRIIISSIVFLAISAPIMWHFMHDYQKARILTFLSPARDPRGNGYQIIQSKIAIGSGGFWGKGWLHGSQTHLQFLPAHSTDFIFAVAGEEIGFAGCAILIAIFCYLAGRGLYISSRAQDTFSRLLTGSLILTFFLSFFVNTGMVMGILPVVGLPLPLVSYGGSSLITLMTGFGIIMSVHTHRRLLSN